MREEHGLTWRKFLVASNAGLRATLDSVESRLKSEPGFRSNFEDIPGSASWRGLLADSQITDIRDAYRAKEPSFAERAMQSWVGGPEVKSETWQLVIGCANSFILPLTLVGGAVWTKGAELGVKLAIGAGLGAAEQAAISTLRQVAKLRQSGLGIQYFDGAMLLDVLEDAGIGAASGFAGTAAFEGLAVASRSIGLSQALGAVGRDIGAEVRQSVAAFREQAARAADWSKRVASAAGEGFVEGGREALREARSTAFGELAPLGAVGRGVKGAAQKVSVQVHVEPPASAASATSASEGAVLQPTGARATAPGRTIYVTPSGRAIDVPDNWVVKPARTNEGIVFQKPGADAVHPDASSVRVMDPAKDARYPQGYYRYYNESGQPLKPSTGGTGTRPETHIPTDYTGELKRWPIPPREPPQ